MTPKVIPPNDPRDHDGCWIGFAAFVLILFGGMLAATFTDELRALGTVLFISGIVCVGWSYIKFFFFRPKSNPTKENTPK